MPWPVFPLGISWNKLCVCVTDLDQRAAPWLFGQEPDFGLSGDVALVSYLQGSESQLSKAEKAEEQSGLFV